jgi:CheY-like chemotaxis protein
MTDFPSEAIQILLVEDDPAAQRMKQLLEMQLGLPVQVAAAVDEAIALLREKSFGVVVIDIMMTPGDFGDEPPVNPLLAGHRLAIRLQEGSIRGCRTAPSVPILIYTAVASAGIIGDCRARFGEENVLCKPCEIERLSERIRGVFCKRALLIGEQMTVETRNRVARSTPFCECIVARNVEEAVQTHASATILVALILTEPSEKEKKNLEAAFPQCVLLVRSQVDQQAVREMAACVNATERPMPMTRRR